MTLDYQLRLNPLTGRWVVVSTERAKRPDFSLEWELQRPKMQRQCPFCEGGEEFDTGDIIKGHDFRIRIVPNKYPAFQGLGSFVVNNLGPVFTEASAFGIHELLVFSDSHENDWGDLSDSNIKEIMFTFKNRSLEHLEHDGLRYTQIIVNNGRQAGASLDHPHAQIIGIPFIPKELADEQAGFTRFAGGCILCTCSSIEKRLNYRLIKKGKNALAISPFWSGIPYEILVIPEKHASKLYESDEEVLAEVGIIIKHCITALKNVGKGPVSYNIVFHSMHHRSAGSFHWHVHILPSLVTNAGFELGTGVFINVISPEKATLDLRG